jgi:LPS-assembly protein
MHYRFSSLTCAQTILWAMGLVHIAHAQSLTCDINGNVSRSLPVTQVSRHAPITELPIELKAEGAETSSDGWNTLTGNVEIIQGDRTIRTETLRINSITKDMTARGLFEFEDSTLFLTGNDASLQRTGSAEVDQAAFLLKSSAGRGSAQTIRLAANGNVSLDQVNYTTCPVATPDWELKLSDLDINQATRTGTGRNARLDFKGIPIFYTPWISFPVSNERKSGFLFPSFGGSTRGGDAISIPWYWNMAPNYDDTLTPSYITNRGFKVENEFRYLGQTSRTTLVTGYLPHDQSVNEWRGSVGLDYENNFTEALQLKFEGNAVSDHRWYEDFGTSSTTTSLPFAESSVALSAHSANWYGELQLQHLETLDDRIAQIDRPFTQIPRLSIQGRETFPLGMRFSLDSELTHFNRGSINSSTLTYNTNGTRLYLNPSLTLPLKTSGMYLTPSMGWHYTRYQLNTSTAQKLTPSLSGALYSLDTGLIFERLTKSQNQIQTLEPRLLYVYVPYRNQSNLPMAFDTAIPDLNLVQLFRTNRFIGPDRLGDTHQISAGFTTRLLNTGDGSQYLVGTFGQAFYLKKPCITSVLQTQCDTQQSARSSDLIGELSLTAHQNLSINLGTQWTPENSRTQRSNIFMQYRSDKSHIINLGYRYDWQTLEQWESSIAWPINAAWSGYGRVVYSQLDRKFLDHFAGLEYRSCCFNIRAVAGRSITTRSGEYDTQYKLQLDLKGLSSIGTADAFLTGGIAGYSAERH